MRLNDRHLKSGARELESTRRPHNTAPGNGYIEGTH
jgi:hypothetical protein